MIGAMDNEILGDDDVFAELAKIKPSKGNTSVSVQGDVNEESDEDDGLMKFGGEEGQLTVDVFEDEDNIYVQSAIAGVNPDDLDVNITKEAVSIKGKRERTHKVSNDGFFYQECFWGSFSRSVVLPEEVNASKSSATFKNGVLTIKMPKIDKRRSGGVKVRLE